jgi:hypothetical protein
LKALDAQLPEPEENRAEVAQLLAAAVATASARPTGPAAAQELPPERACAGTRNTKQQQQQPQEHQLLLQSFSCNHPSNLLLHQAAASCSNTLARLEVSMQLRMEEDAALAVAGAEASLRSLRSLSLTFITEQTPSATTPNLE